MTNNQELAFLWAKHFSSPFPESAAPFWATFNPVIIEKGLGVMAKKSRKHPFANMAEACRYATTVMRSTLESEAMEQTPAPSPLVTITNDMVDEFRRRIYFTIFRFGPLTKAGIQKFSNAFNCEGGFDAWRRAWTEALEQGKVVVVGKSERGKEKYGIPSPDWKQKWQHRLDQLATTAVSNVA